LPVNIGGHDLRTDPVTGQATIGSLVNGGAGPETGPAPPGLLITDERERS